MSIKNKFVTAITTAGLLAGLFGSAFVPSASAGVNDPDLDYTYAYLENYGNGIDDGYITASNASDAGGSYKGDDVYSLEAISWWAPYGMVANSSEYDEYDAEDYSIGFEIRNSTDDPVQEVDLVATATGAAFEFAWPYEDDSEDVNRCQNPNLDWTTTSQSVDNVVQDGNNDDVDSYEDAEGTYFLCVRSKNAFDGDSGVLTVRANGVTIATINVTVFGDIESIALSTKYGITNIAQDNNEIGDFWNVLFKDNAGQTLNANGDKNWAYIPDLYNYETDDYLDEDGTGNGHCEDGDIECLEPTGSAREYNADGDVIDFFDTYAFYNHESRAGLESGVCEVDDKGESYTAVAEFTNLDGARIRSNGVTIKCSDQIEDYEITDLKMEYTSSNTLSGEADWLGSDQGGDDVPTCDWDAYDFEADYATLVGAETVYSGIEIHATVKDTAGNVMGIDASSGFAGLTVTAVGNGDLGWDSGVSGFIGNGTIRVGCYVPDMSRAAKFSLAVTVADPDTSTGSEADLVETFYYVASLELDYTLTRVRNAAKTSATWTADWGLDCSNAVVYFDWVNKAGTKGTLVTGTSPIARVANLDGVASFTLKRRNMTIYVTAYPCDDFSEDIDELGPVKARFR